MDLIDHSPVVVVSEGEDATLEWKLTVPFDVEEINCGKDRESYTKGTGFANGGKDTFYLLGNQTPSYQARAIRGDVYWSFRNLLIETYGFMLVLWCVGAMRHIIIYFNGPNKRGS